MERGLFMGREGDGERELSDGERELERRRRGWRVKD